MSENLYLKIFKILTKKIFIVFFLFAVILLLLFVQNISYPHVIKAQVQFRANNISTWIQNTGTFNQDIRTTNTPGFEWPKGSGKFAIFTSGLSIAALINGTLRMASASFSGEYAPGYVVDSNGIPLFKTDSRFRLYSVRTGDTYMNNPDVIAWKDMVPFGAPFTDVNNNKIYDVKIDKPGMPDASQTIFVCLTDADSTNHSSSEGFGGGTLPIYAEVHLTAWGYQTDPVNNVQFIKWDVINKNSSKWEKVYFSLFTFSHLGDYNDDYIGSDTNLSLTYNYNGTNMDGTGSGNSYGINPPAAGQMFLRGGIANNNNTQDTLKMTSSCYVTSQGGGGIVCEMETGNIYQAYNFMKGVKRDGTPWVIPNTNPPQPTKFCFSGNPETMEGWTEFSGAIRNCGSLYGQFQPSLPGERDIIFSSGSDLLNVNPLDTQKIVIAQMIARGNNYLNSVTKLKELASITRRVYFEAIEGKESYYVEPPVSLPQSYKMFQNYPNPFNPVTTIKYEMKRLWKVKIQVYDMKGELISTLVNEEKPQGVYEVKFDASGLPSGVYFYKMTSSEGFEDSKKMVVIK